MLDRGINRIAGEKGSEYFSQPISQLLFPYKYRFVNLECPITLQNNPLPKQIVFRGRPELISILQKSKITHASLANNHANDQHAQGLRDTYRVLDSIGIYTVGAGSQTNSSCKPIELTDQGSTIAVFSYLDLRISRDETENLCACEAENLATKIWEYKNNHPRALVVCYIHWGIEYNPSPSVGQRETAKMLIDAGADAIVGHHPHVIQKIEYYKHKPIFYSLGNFVFDQMSPETRSGIVVGFDNKDNSLQAQVIPYAIDNGRPVQVSSEENNNVMKKLIAVSKNVEFKKDKNSWAIAETKSSDRSDAAIETKGHFDPKLINDRYFKGVVSLEGLSQLSGYRLSVVPNSKSSTDELHVPYPVYRFEIGDLNRDGKTDILLGVIKSTHFDQRVIKRLFALRIDSGQIRPLWLGSKVCQNLVDFKAIDAKGRTSILTIEQSNDGTFSNGIYEWEDFGLRLVRYANENLNYAQALNNLEDEKP